MVAPEIYADCPFCWYDAERQRAPENCALCRNARRVLVGVAIEFSLLELPRYKPWMERRNEGPTYRALKRELRELRRRHKEKTNGTARSVRA